MSKAENQKLIEAAMIADMYHLGTLPSSYCNNNSCAECFFCDFIHAEAVKQPCPLISAKDNGLAQFKEICMQMGFDVIENDEKENDL